MLFKEMSLLDADFSHANLAFRDFTRIIDGRCTSATCHLTPLHLSTGGYGPCKLYSLCVNAD